MWFSKMITGRYAIHWERRHIDGTIYRHDNRPHQHLKDMRTFPKHFHNGSDDMVEESHLSNDPIEAARAFLEFMRHRLQTR